jgi:xylan 1,4-beta-xylosidase
VALAFVSGEYGPKPYPIKQLAGYKRLKCIDPGETRRVDLEMRVGSLARVDESGNTALYPGEYSLLLDVPTRAVVNLRWWGMRSFWMWPKPPEGW